ncbi:MAG: DNA polymerase III subunit gamma/tau [Gemmatimonadaceae bacterium]
MISLARKYRPKTFADVAVQSHVSNTLKGAIARGRVAHGYLLCGPRGVGKTTLARVLAMALNCERKETSGARDGEPCGECESCTRIWKGFSNLDVVEIDAASNRGVDDARELRERAMYAPTTSESYRVYIVDEAHMLTREAWNALLKIIEEPPPRVVFVFATTEPQKIAQSAAPVLSRLQRFDFKRISPAAVRQRLDFVLSAEGVIAEPEAVAMIARAADGSMRDALSFVDQSLSTGDGKLTAELVRDALGLVPEDEIISILDLIAGKRAADVFPAVGKLVDAGVDLGTFLPGLAEMLRSLLALSLGGAAPDLSDRAREALTKLSNRFSTGDILRMLAAITELEPRFKKSGQQQLVVESLLVRFALMDRTVVLEEMLKSMGVGGGVLGVGSEPKGPGARVETNEVRPERQQPTKSSLPAETNPHPTPHTLHPLMPLELKRLSERWDDVIAHVKAEGFGSGMLVAALENAVPSEVSRDGEVTLMLEGPNEVLEKALAAGKDTILKTIRTLFIGAKAIIVRTGAEPAQQNAPSTSRRMSEEDARANRLARLRKRDPNLDAAVEALDLELLD